MENQSKTRIWKLFIETVLFLTIISVALYVGFYNPEDLTHPLHGDLLVVGNAIYNLHNKIPYEVNGFLQWIAERTHYFYINFLYNSYGALFWDNSKDYVTNLIPSTALLVIFSYLAIYLFTRCYFGRKIALLGLFLMSLSSYWYNYTNRSLYGAWAALPGVCVAIYWLYLKFNESRGIRFMIYAGLIAGVAFYFTTWPLFVIAMPSLFISSLILPSEISKKKLIFGIFSCILMITIVIIAKEFIFLKTGLRYNDDPSGVQTFYYIFIKDRYFHQEVGEMGQKLFGSLINRVYSNFSVLFRYFLFPSTTMPNIDNLFMQKPGPEQLPLISGLVLLSLVPGIYAMIKEKKRYIFSFLPTIFLIIFLLVTVVMSPRQRYLLPAFPIPYIICAFFIIRTFGIIRKALIKYLFILLVGAGILWNSYETFYKYMHRVLPIYSRFEYNCYNSIEWPFSELKRFLKKKAVVYDVIVIPNNFTPQAISYFRLDPGFIHVERESYAKLYINYHAFRKIAHLIQKDETLRVLVIANNFNYLLEDYKWPVWGNRWPYDKHAVTVSEVRKLVPTARLVQYVGCKNYPNMLALFEIGPDADEKE